MKVNVPHTPGKQIEAFYLFFIIHTLQIGAGLMGVPRYVFEMSKQDAWISVLIAGLYMHLIIYLMIHILKCYENADLFGIQVDLFGRVIGTLLGSVYLVYFFFLNFTVMLNYIEVVQVFIFPNFSQPLLSLMLIAIAIYAVLGGFRVAVGVSVVFFFATIWLIATIYVPIKMMDWNHFLPIMEASPTEILKGVYKTTYTIIGLEVLFFVYPFVKNKNKVSLPSHLAVFFTTFLVLLVTVVSIGFFAEDQLKQTVWATLTLFKVVSFPILERFDMIAISLWLLVILPNFIMITWLFTYGVKRLYRIPQRTSLYVYGGALFIGSFLVKYRVDINTITNYSAIAGFWIAFVYPILLFPLVWLKTRKRRSEQQ
ncbi:GerAB/ArcD/ProY family transporter [Thalassobacillus hwangdonensis]|uniref:GerAB/ArcD/ProY family transporter n=1 Tax=Thalassobacillus hwangdonensis TaxID=546108 RepID=A0ABW3KVE4_9BACI